MKIKDSYKVNIVVPSKEELKKLKKIEKEIKEEDKNLDLSELKIYKPQKK